MSEWTIETLKEHFEQQLAAQKEKFNGDVALITAAASNASEALIKQASEYERRLSALNHEAERINAANATNVNRQVYEGDLKSNDEWKRRIEALVANAVSTSEFQSYKDSTSTALNLQAGQRAGVGWTGQTILAFVIGLSALIGAAYLFVPHGSQPAPVIYVTPSVAPPGEPATVKVKP